VDVDTFKDDYIVFDDEDTDNEDALSKAQSCYNDVLSEKIIDKDWYVYTASLCISIKTTY
jgi:hypothetical protein